MVSDMKMNFGKTFKERVRVELEALRRVSEKVSWALLFGLSLGWSTLQAVRWTLLKRNNLSFHCCSSFIVLMFHFCFE